MNGRRKRRQGAAGIDLTGITDQAVATALRSLWSSQAAMEGRMGQLTDDSGQLPPEAVVPFSEDGAEVSRLRQQVERLSRQLEQIAGSRTEIGLQAQAVRNVDSVAFPSYSALEITGISTEVGALECVRPTAASMDPAGVLFTGPAAIGAGELGYAYRGGMAGVKVGVDVGTVSADDLGTTASQFYLTVGNTGFKALGVDDANGRVMIAAAGGGLSVTEVEVLPEIPTRLKVVQWIGGTGDGGLWVAWPDATQWFPWGHLTDKSGAPE